VIQGTSAHNHFVMETSTQSVTKANWQSKQKQTQKIADKANIRRGVNGGEEVDNLERPCHFSHHDVMCITGAKCSVLLDSGEKCWE
jgi:hypothetical protein